MKATAASVRLRIYLFALTNANSLRVLGSLGPNPGTGAQGPPGRDRKPGRLHHGGADPGQGLPKSPLPEVADRHRKFS